LLHRSQLAGAVLSAVRTTGEVMLASVPADRDADDVGGVLWPSEVDAPQPTMRLFGDRLPVGLLDEVDELSIRLDTAEGGAWLAAQLAPFRVEVPEMPTDGPPKVFINYRSSDDKQAVTWIDEELCDRLGQGAVFRDSRILPGVDYADELLTKVRGTKLLLVVIAERWEKTYDNIGARLIDNPDDWTRKEIVEADKHGAGIVPVLVGAREFPTEDVLPVDIRLLTRLQHLQLPRGYTRRDVCYLIDKLVLGFPKLGGRRCRKSHD
jgi:hypothetical protein